jgi:hypothetical protein
MSPNKKGGLQAALSFSTSSGIFILSKEMLVLSFVGFLADVEELRRNDMPAFGEPRSQYSPFKNLVSDRRWYCAKDSV